MKNTAKFLIFLVFILSIYSCQSYTHVVASDSSLMNIKTGKIEKAKLDSTFRMYDKVKIVDGVVVKAKN